MGKKTTVELSNTALNTTQSFDIDHAERLLRLPKNGGWQLPEDSPFNFDFDNGINHRAGKDSDSVAQQSRRNKQSHNAPEQN